LISGDISSCTTWLAGAMKSFGRKYTMHARAERPDPSGLPFGRHTCFLLIPQARRAPLSFLPDVLAFLLLLIYPFFISMSFPWVIINLIYF
jgi:hypothetical protein